ncbi:MAG: M12 family metallo-peptidase [Myxococcota bacterium]|nr:M12 family metallo-peptidase [Myxococcota bacterium]
MFVWLVAWIAWPLAAAGQEKATVFRAGAAEGTLPSVHWKHDALRGLRPSRDEVRIRDFPLPPDRRVDLELEPFSVVSDRTRFVVGRLGRADAPLPFDPDEVILLRGEVRGKPGSRVFLALRKGASTGHIQLGPGEASYRISSRGSDGRLLEEDRTVVFETRPAPELPPGVPFCGVDGEARPVGPSILAPQTRAAPPEPFVGIQHLELAVETDYEFFRLFGNLDDAAAYVVALYGAVSDIYLRDTDTWVDLTFVRLWDDPNDLFNVVDPSPLGEFRSYWNANMGGVQRDIAQLLSGRRDYPFGGQASLSALCGSSGYSVVGYAVGEFPDPTQPSPLHYDLSVTAHEIGHNAGTGHTHDSPNFVDECDDPFSVPQRGSIMSYCSQTWSGGNANRDLYFHSRIQQNIDAHIAASSCIVDDCNLNGTADSLDVSGGTSLDANGNGMPDECEDCNDNGVLDPADIAAGAPDLDADGIPDECQPDCNANGVPDLRDIALGTSVDAYGDDVPDECEVDCDGDGVSDYTEIQLDMSLDIDRNRALDACQDCDGDTIPDGVERDRSHDLWLASGLAATPIRSFHASSGVLSASSSGGLVDEGQDLIVTPDRRVLVTSAGDDRVMEFDVDGAYQGDLVPSGAGGLSHPHALTLTPDGTTLLVASATNHSVLAYDAATGASQGAFVASGAGGLSDPFGLTFGPDGHLYVTSGGDRVLRYDGASGGFLDVFVAAADNGGLAGAKGLLFKPDGNLLVASYGTDQTLEFDGQDGGFLRRWALSGNSTRLNQVSPWGLRIGPNGNVFIVRTGEAFGSAASGSEHEHDHAAHHHDAFTEVVEVEQDEANLHLTNAQIYEFDVRNGNFLRAHVNGNDHGVEFPTGFDFVPGDALDCNRNQFPDACDISSGVSLDVDSSGVPDECEIDCNANGVQDRLDLIPFGTGFDCNANSVPDECDSAAGVAGACEPIELTCDDGFDNDRDGPWDCFDAHLCGSDPACDGRNVLFVATFDSGDASGFTYLDDAFRSTSEPAYASGDVSATDGYRGGGLRVDLGGIDGADIFGMSGAFERSVTVPTGGDVEIAFRYRLTQSEGYESNERSEMLVAWDGVLLTNGSNDFVAELTGDGNGGVPLTTGWMQHQVVVPAVSAGVHTLTLGAYNSQKTLPDESTEVLIDDVAILSVALPACSDGIDNDGDLLVDHPADPGCASPASDLESPACNDGIDNDNDGGIDFDGAPPDPQCVGKPSRNKESQGCGIGFELAPLLLGLAWWRRRR